MKRRRFLEYAAGAVVMPGLLKPFSVKATGSSPFSTLSRLTNDTDHVLVLISLNGGNDGLNTLVPLDQLSALNAVRPDVVLPQNSLLPLNGIADAAFHPAMGEMRRLYDEGKMQVIQSVGYPDPNFSHFRSTDIWNTASDSQQLLATGWLGRYLNYEYPNYPAGYPNQDMPDPLAIQIGSYQSLAFQGPMTNMSVVINNADDFYDLLNGVQSPAPATPAGEKLEYIRQVAHQCRQYSSNILSAAANINSQAPYPANNALAEQLKIVARLIAGGLMTRIYMVEISGFDTHDNQVVDNNHTIGDHANLLQQLSDAIGAFVDDLSYLGIEQRVLGMTVSEFGRRIISNGSLGTDHGTAAPMFVFGSALQPGILGSNPIIPFNAGEDDNLPMQFDFRSVYATMLRDWFCVPDADLGLSMLQTFPILPIVNSPSCVTPLHEVNAAAGQLLISNAPNPFVHTTTIQYTCQKGYVMIQIFSSEGRLVATPVSQSTEAGTFTCSFNAEQLPAGIYYARLQNGAAQQVRALQKVRG